MTEQPEQPQPGPCDDPSPDPDEREETDAEREVSHGLAYIRATYPRARELYARWCAAEPHWYSRGGFLRGVTGA